MTVELAPEAREDDRELLIAMAKAFDAAWDRRDTDAFLTHFTPDADFGGVGGPIARGLDALRQHFEAFFPTLPPGLRHVTRPLVFRFPTDEIAVVDVEVDMVQAEDDGTETYLYTFPAVCVGQRMAPGTEPGCWRVSMIRTGPAPNDA